MTAQVHVDLSPCEARCIARSVDLCRAVFGPLSDKAAATDGPLTLAHAKIINAMERAGIEHEIGFEVEL